MSRDLLQLLREPKIDPSAVAALLDAASHADRVTAIRTLGGREQQALWHAVDGVGRVTLDDIVPIGETGEVRHFGKNTLPLFTHFEKRFCRGGEGELHGYNFQESGIASWFSGPGYFVATEDAQRGEVLIDYRKLPESHPPSWPEIRSNEMGGAKLVYGFMVDTLRRVSTHVTIGRANRKGKDMNAWFVLARDARNTP